MSFIKLSRDITKDVEEQEQLDKIIKRINQIGAYAESIYIDIKEILDKAIDDINAKYR